MSSKTERNDRKQGKSFAEAASSKAMNVSTSITYSVNSVQNQKFEHSFAIAYGAMSLHQGELSKAQSIATSYFEQHQSK